MSSLPSLISSTRKSILQSRDSWTNMMNPIKSIVGVPGRAGRMQNISEQPFPVYTRSMRLLIVTSLLVYYVLRNPK
jgi:hypothetical protein